MLIFVPLLSNPRAFGIPRRLQIVLHGWIVFACFVFLKMVLSHLLFDVLHLPDLAPGNDEIYEEKQETFLTPGNPQDGQVVLYKVGTT